MHRFYVKDGEELAGGDFHHAIEVLRLSEGSQIEVVMGLGRRFLAKITEIDKKNRQAKFAIIQQIEKSSEPPCKITLIQGVPRLDKLSEIIEHCTQLGVSKFVLAECARSQGHHPKERWDKKMESLKKVAKSAAELSSREVVPEILGPLDFGQALKQGDGTMLIPWELEQTLTIPKAITDKLQALTIFIGPEGGLEHKEIDMAKTFGFAPVTLGSRILRAQLASVVAISMALAVIEG